MAHWNQTPIQTALSCCLYCPYLSDLFGLTAFTVTISSPYRLLESNKGSSKCQRKDKTYGSCCRSTTWRRRQQLVDLENTIKEIQDFILIKNKQTNSDVLLGLRIKNKQTNKKIQFLDPSRQLFYADPKPCLTTPDFKGSVIWGFHKKRFYKHTRRPVSVRWLRRVKQEEKNEAFIFIMIWKDKFYCKLSLFGTLFAWVRLRCLVKRGLCSHRYLVLLQLGRKSLGEKINSAEYTSSLP